MNWRTLKIFAIVALIVMNLVLLGTILERRRSISYYDDALVKNSMTLFAESGLEIDEAYLREKIQTPSAFLGTFDQQALNRLSLAFSSQGYTVTETANGFCFRDSDEEFIIGNDFSFSYFYGENMERPQAILAYGDSVRVTEPRFTVGPFSVAKAFLFDIPNLWDSEKYAYGFVEDGVYYVEGGTVIIVRQTVNGAVLEDGIALLIREGRVCAAEGRFAMVLPEGVGSAQTVGLLEILFSEKEMISALGSPKTVEDISYTYAPYFDADGSFYFVPMCRIAYTDGVCRTYNFVSGEFYAESSFFE